MSVCVKRERGARRPACGLMACVPCACRAGCVALCVWLRCVLCVCCAYLLLGGVQRLSQVVVRLIDRAGGGGEAAELEVGVLLGAVVLGVEGGVGRGGG